MAEEAKAPPAWKSFLAGGVAGVCLVGVGHPLDTIKVRLQTQPHPPLYTGAMDCFQKTVKKEGFLGLYRGMAAPIVGVAPLYALCFLAYDTGKKLQGAERDDDLSLLQHGYAGALAGVATTAIMAPGERLKCLLQIQEQQPKEVPRKYKGTGDAAVKLYKEGGIRSLYRGTVATLLRDVPATFMYFASYVGMKRLLTPEGGTEKDLGPGKLLLAGGCAGIFNWAVAIAPDTLKSRLQTAPDGAYNGVRDVLKELLAKEGAGALFKGIGPIMVRAFPANAASFFGYEMTMKLLNYAFPDE
eukprot:CAMPEP_0113894014 /NCGR_PEP_ID=MMETSP0780_2-20120614/16442_1 /TAXON_ID=652834 /ORGANISM="Palpitomonas bilix" /LENGTH=298 /DNA_ID=CAMNT_0000884427 /DNA_START=36 /DNA_END=932 /DNA_ORIENTATION=- /assembly_acc=CAM_ASM_000599